MKSGPQNSLCDKDFNLHFVIFMIRFYLMKIIDMHTHVDYITPDFQPDVVECVCCATTEDSWKKIVNLCNKDNRVYGAVGVHPWFVDSVDDGFDFRLEQLLASNSNYMIGEIGLDKYKPNMEKQQDIFIKQFEIAMKLKRIVFLHCVGAWDKILHILKQYRNLPIIVVHDFNANKDILHKVSQYKNMYFSFGKNVLYDRNYCIENIDVNKILVETDGKKDVFLKDIIKKISDIKNDENIFDIIYNNTRRILENG